MNDMTIGEAFKKLRDDARKLGIPVKKGSLNIGFFDTNVVAFAEESIREFNTDSNEE